MHSWAILTAVVILAGCTSGGRPVPPSKLVEIDSEEFQTVLAERQATALANAALSTGNVKRIFIVGWTIDYGINFTSLTPYPSDIGLPYFVTPDFVDDEIQNKFVRALSHEELSNHVGQRLLCECTGIEWSFHGTTRFLVREAELRFE